eukprot:TRINITY_DN21514_c0_g4_i1.p1 TRINITY_DN21514_c0_g4~~TRINITY_DN21514_c0_g4_i1.p1  ORF type:complete len:926 (+),score=154.25 TRINITY_DN21514_c0_g4_i1:28-2778(+)
MISFDGDACPAPRGKRCLVLVDSCAALARPLCPPQELQRAIIDEVLGEDTAASQVTAGISALFGRKPAPVNKDEIRARAAATTRAVLAGERAPPGAIRCAIDAVGELLVSGRDRSAFDVECIVFADAGDERCASKPSGHVRAVAPSELPRAWRESQQGRGGVLEAPSLAEACACEQGLRSATCVIVVTTRGFALGPLLDASWRAPPPLFWLHCFGCAAGDAAPDAVLQPGLEQICTSGGGLAKVARGEADLLAVVQAALSCAGSRVQDSVSSPAAFQSLPSAMMAPAMQLAETFGMAVQAPPSRPAASAEGRDTGTVVGASVMKAVIARAGDVSMLSPSERQARVRELVAQEMRLQNAQSVRTHSIEKVLCASRDVEQRVLLEWFICLCSIEAYTGSAVTLARSCCVSKLWRSSLRIDGSAIARSLWKWIIRFGDPLPLRCRWAYWSWLRNVRGCKDIRKYKASRLARVQEYEVKLATGCNEPTLADARQVISADVPRTFACATDMSPLLAHGQTVASSYARCVSLERILIAVVASNASLGYSQGLHLAAAFALSVAEDAGFEGSAAEAEAFALLSELVGSKALSSLMDPSLVGLRTSAHTFASLLRDRVPRVETQVRNDGADPGLLALPWFQTLFAGLSSMPRSTLCRIWECWLFEGTLKTFHRVSLALVMDTEKYLVGQPLEYVSDALRNFPKPLDQSLDMLYLISGACATKITNKQLGALLKTSEDAVRQGSCPIVPLCNTAGGLDLLGEAGPTSTPSIINAVQAGPGCNAQGFSLLGDVEDSLLAAPGGYAGTPGAVIRGEALAEQQQHVSSSNLAASDTLILGDGLGLTSNVQGVGSDATKASADPLSCFVDPIKEHKDGVSGGYPGTQSGSEHAYGTTNVEDCLGFVMDTPAAAPVPPDVKKDEPASLLD